MAGGFVEMSEKKKDNETKAYAARIKDRDVLIKSSSGGVFTAISDIFLDQGDAVVCSLYDCQEKKQVFHIITDKIERDASRGSKYMQSDPKDIFQQSISWLRNNPQKHLLFIGTGCQAIGFQSFIEIQAGELRDRVYTADIICHGSPSPMIWKEYIELLEKKHKGQAGTPEFKDKRNGWKSPTAVVSINGFEVPLKTYINIYYTSRMLRPSCHKCPYTIMKRQTDLTFGDYWGIEDKLPDFYDRMGNSLLLIHTERMQDLFQKMQDALDYCESSLADCWQLNLEYPTPASAKRNVFWRDYYKYGLSHIVKKYKLRSFMIRIKNKANKMLGHLSKR